MRYRLRTLLIGMAVGPPLLALAWMAGRPTVTDEHFMVLLVAVGLGFYGLFAFGAGFAIAWVISAVPFYI
jgi:hypothetical protein